MRFIRGLTVILLYPNINLTEVLVLCSQKLYHVFNKLRNVNEVKCVKYVLLKLYLDF